LSKFFVAIKTHKTLILWLNLNVLSTCPMICAEALDRPTTNF
jgi:hypothetical protein